MRYGQLDFEHQTPVERAIARLKQFEPPEGYYLAFSGGKDSVALLGLAQQSGVMFDAHHSLTTIDPPELVQFVKTCPVQIEYPEKSFHQLVQYHGLPLRQSRWCCQELKERGGSGRIVLTGIRAQESTKRKGRNMVETCYLDSTKRFVHPIIDWSKADVWAYIRDRNLSYCSLYDEGFERLGCILCPMTRDTERQMKRWPKTCEAIKHSVYRLWNQRSTVGTSRTTPAQFLRKHPTPEALWQWWIDRDAHLPNECEQRLFD